MNKVEDDLGMTGDEENEILQMFARDSAIRVEGLVAKTQSLVICDDVVAKRLEGWTTWRDEVYSPKSLDMKGRNGGAYGFNGSMQGSA